MSWGGAAGGRLELSAVDNLSGAMSRKGFRTIDLLSVFVTPGGSPTDRGARLSRDFNLREEILRGRVKVHTKPIAPNGIIWMRLRVRLISIIPHAAIAR